METATKNFINISKRAIQQKGGVVILPLEEYKKLTEATVPTYYLTGREAENLDKLVEKGLKDHQEGKTIKARSLGEALRIYGKKKDKKS